MFDILERYSESDHFFFTSGDRVAEVCNAPADKSGVYLIYALKGGRIELIYIGRAGKVNAAGVINTRNAGPRGLKGRMVNDELLGEPGRNSWTSRMILDRIEALDVYWYVTHCDEYTDCPEELENTLLSTHLRRYGRLPRWNKPL